MALTIVQFRCRSDNYGVLLHDEATGATASVDAPDGDIIAAELRARDWQLDAVFTTHHHADHVAGNLSLKAAFACTVVGPALEAGAIPGIDRGVADGATVAWAGREVAVMATPGHTRGHVAYWIASEAAVFTGDTLFACGCGRLFEGTADMMWDSLVRLRALPPTATVYCGHDYSAANTRFALTIDPDNAALAVRAADAARRQATGALAPPTTIASERETNPFLRADDPGIAARLGLAGRPAAAVFAELRRRKDTFA